ncbi:RecJ domain-containing protein [Halostagnicola larsenii XH-48]|uniref:RecJ domain-containing protein n=1 Tax=Halostagnicola larsenii XH-48 TaxID=797299 RepID=W0JNG6_9EURY|nr:OB-fold nucleic acid binding domain-containing protein [Halostagnicola larsenii]AHF98714.1 RecJ domain-containing protein [Halostagnicola larsenii XH-48]
MGNCIICDKPVDGLVCEVHEEDVAFEFEGTSASQLSPGRFYRGTVDGYADFGVFVDVGDHVTGLLHRSELDQRLESLDWEPGDSVYVQVLDVRDNGNIDLGWSIRQDDRDFRGRLIETADDELRPEEFEEDTDESAADADDSPDQTESAASSTDSSSEVVANGSGSTATDSSETDSSAAETTDSPETTASPEATESASEVEHDASTTDTDQDSDFEFGTEPSLNRTTVGDIDSQVGSIVRLEGEITGIRQTSGPTVFELSDETATVECAAFEEAGVRAYPDVDLDDVVALEGEVERHHGDLQIETEALEILTDDERATVLERLEEAIEQEARPSVLELIDDHDAVSAVEDELFEAATQIRRAVMESRPIVVRHQATADGYIAGAAIERAVLPLIEDKHTRDDAVYHYFERRPLEGRVYDMDAATDDVTSMLEARDRHGEQLPLVILVDAGATAESANGYDLLSLYDTESIVIDDSRADEEITDAVSLAVAPSLTGADVSDLTSTALGANVAAAVNDDVRGDLEHLPAVSYWEDVPESYLELATDAGYDEETLAERREAVALEAFYQSYKDKRELVTDLLFDDDGDLAAHVSEQFRDKLETELEAASENCAVRGVGDVTVSILDTGSFTHRYNFPTTTLLLDALHRRERTRADPPFVTLGVGDDELHVRATETLDVRELASELAERVPDAGVSAVGGRDGHVEYLVGERDAVEEATVEILGETLA